MNAQRTSAEETERTLRAESVLSDDRLPVKWDGEYIYWADTWTDTMPFLCGNNNLLKDQACPGTDEKRSGSWTNPTMGRKAATPSSKENSTSKKTKPAHSGGKDRNDRNDQTESKRPSTW